MLPLLLVPLAGSSLGSTSWVGWYTRPRGEISSSPRDFTADTSVTVTGAANCTRMPSNGSAVATVKVALLSTMKAGSGLPAASTAMVGPVSTAWLNEGVLAISCTAPLMRTRLPMATEGLVCTTYSASEVAGLPSAVAASFCT